MRLAPEEEHAVFLAKCESEKIAPSKELFAAWKAEVDKRQAWFASDDFKRFEKERIRKQQRTVTQTIQEDGAIISPIDDKQYVTERSWEEHKKIEDVVEVGNENANKRKAKK